MQSPLLQQGRFHAHISSLSIDATDGLTVGPESFKVLFILNSLMQVAFIFSTVSFAKMVTIKQNYKVLGSLYSTERKKP